MIIYVDDIPIMRNAESAVDQIFKLLQSNYDFGVPSRIEKLLATIVEYSNDNLKLYNEQLLERVSKIYRKEACRTMETISGCIRLECY